MNQDIVDRTKKSDETVTLSQRSDELESSATKLQLPKDKKSKRAKTIVGLLVGLLVILGSLAYYFLIYVPNKPENVLFEGLFNTLSGDVAKSGKINATFDFDGKEYPEYLGEVKLAGSFDDKENVSYIVSTNLLGNDLSVELVKVGEDTYVKLTGTKDLQTILKKLKAEDVLGKNSGLTLKFFGTLDGQWIKTDETFDQFTSFISGRLGTTELSDEDAEKVAQLYKENPVIQVDEVLPDETIDGQSSNHYKASINKENYLAFLLDMKKEKIPGIAISVSPEEYLKSQNELDQDLEIWVSKSDKIINKLILDIKSSDSSVRISTERADTNEPITIVAPEGAKSFGSLLKSNTKAN